MPADDSPAILVARFLRSNNYDETLNAFLIEAGLPPDAGSNPSKALTIEQVLQEKKAYDLSVNFEKLGVDEKASAWTKITPLIPKQLNLPTSTNILSLSLEKLQLGNDPSQHTQVLLVSTAERRLHMLVRKGPKFEALPSDLGAQDSPILSFVVSNARYVTFTCMSGRLTTYDVVMRKQVASRKDHSKYVVQVARFYTLDDLVQPIEWFATAGWDGKVLLYLRKCPIDTMAFELGDPIATIPQPSNPEAVYFVRNPDTKELYLIVTRRDSSFLYYYRLPSRAPMASTIDIPLSGRQNLAPHSNAWVAFTPSAVAPHPSDPTLLAVATSAVPHMKLLLVRLLFPGPDSLIQLPRNDIEAPTQPASLLDGPSLATQQARAALALQDREAAAISIHATTMAPQTQYSTPGLAWRPDGSGVWVNGDDGAVRGIEASTGKVKVSLEGGHEAGSKVRCLCAGFVEGEDEGGGEREIMVSGGFDQKLVVWEVE